MIAQIILTGLLTFVLLYAFMEYRRAPAIGLLSMLAAATALYFVWVPAHATRIAALVGIGRGVDLMLYIWVVISLLVLLNLHLKLRIQLEQITILARELAIANVRSPLSAEERVQVAALHTLGDSLFGDAGTISPSSVMKASGPVETSSNTAAVRGPP